MADFAVNNDSAAKSETLWEQFAESESPSRLVESWLGLLCASIGEVAGALVLMGPPDQGPYTPAAIWPDRSCNVQHLAPVAEQALAGRRGVLSDHPHPGNTGESHRHIAYPLEVSGRIHGVAVFELMDRSEPLLQGVMRRIHWGAAWLEVLIRRVGAEEDRLTIERLATLIELTSRSVRYEKFHQVAMALVNELAARLKCDRVGLGLVRHRATTLEAVSNTSKFLKKSNLVKEAEAVMNEAIDQQSFVGFPTTDPRDDALIARVHEDFVARHNLATACTVFLPGRKEAFGALLFERSGEPFAPATLELLRSMGYLLGPILETHWRQEHWFTTGLLRLPIRLLRWLPGPEGGALKTSVLAIVIATLVLALVKTDYRVSAKTVIEGSIQRTLAAPFNGYIATADGRAGDVVHQGQVLCSLDSRDLVLEKRKWLTVGEQYAEKYRQSVANHEYATAQITAAQLKQAEAETALLDEKLSRTRIVAPFDGLLISGDLHQRLGAPVQQGEELFKISPLDRYRVIVQVDERELSYVKVGQKGDLILSSLPGDRFPFVVKRITPVSVTEEGKNYFRVEAQVDKASELLRPGMEGVGKIESGKRRLLWILTHGLVDWLRLKIWSWTP